MMTKWREGHITLNRISTEVARFAHCYLLNVTFNKWREGSSHLLSCTVLLHCRGLLHIPAHAHRHKNITDADVHKGAHTHTHGNNIVPVHSDTMETSCQIRGAHQGQPFCLTVLCAFIFHFTRNISCRAVCSSTCVVFFKSWHNISVSLLFELVLTLFCQQPASSVMKALSIMKLFPQLF